MCLWPSRLPLRSNDHPEPPPVLRLEEDHQVNTHYLKIYKSERIWSAYYTRVNSEESENVAQLYLGVE